ncbi:SRPBCC family protein [Streptomyces sp. NPDC028722]|uniref:SRPBCC family protein n=1 Tax=Streptomyces sp. NPDC028722 TaxID=3155016 RepID=UPI003402CFFF
MEHQVFVPVSAERLRAALADPARVARAVPGLQQDAGAAPIAGRLKLRVGGHSVTYRGALRVTARADGTYAVDADAGEARGDGSVRLALTLRLADGDGGCTVTVRGTADADGRITELPVQAVASAAARLLDRFVAALATDGAQQPEPGAVSEAEVSVSSPEPGADDVCPDRLTDAFTGTGEPPAEAAHARRTMIGRSAEEVDHAPPRGRYAPVPAPQTIAGNPALRWAAPAAALALASAVVLTRALRKRH